ncbi:hypothetical protein KCU90_g4258, partial [Aureobasidium melanogenum]
MNSRREMYDTVDLQRNGPCCVDAREIRTDVDPFVHVFFKLPRTPNKAGDRMPGVKQCATKRMTDKSISACDEHVTHSHFQPNRLKNLYADAMNMRIFWTLLKEIDSAFKRVGREINIRIQHEVIEAVAALDRQIVATAVTHIPMASNDRTEDTARPKPIQRYGNVRQAAVVDQIKSDRQAWPRRMQRVARGAEASERGS